MSEAPRERLYGPSPARSRHGLIVGGVLAAAGLWALLLAGDGLPDRIATGWLALAAGLAFAGHAWWSGRSAGVQLRLGPQGVWFRQWGTIVPWAEIAQVGQSGSRLQPFVTLMLRDPEGFLARAPEADSRALRGNRLWKPPELRIPRSAVAADPEELIAALREWLEDDRGA